MAPFDAVHPSGCILFRSGRGGFMQGIQLTADTMNVFTNPNALAEAILLTGRVSHLKALLEIREETLAAGLRPTAAVPTYDDLAEAESALRNHRW